MSYDEYDRYKFIWEEGTWRLTWWVVDTFLPPEVNRDGFWVGKPGEGGRMHRIVATGKTWTVNGARRQAYMSMERDLAAINGENKKLEDGPAVAGMVEAQRRADMFP